MAGIEPKDSFRKSLLKEDGALEGSHPGSRCKNELAAGSDVRKFSS